jgi:hypothetical protein
MASFGGKGSNVSNISNVGGGGGGGYGGGGAGYQLSGGGGGGGYNDPTATEVTITTGGSSAANGGDADHVGSYGNPGNGQSAGQHGQVTIGAYCEVVEWHERVIKTASGNDIVLENFSGGTRIVLEHQEGISIDGALNCVDETESNDITTGALIMSGGIAVSSLTVGGLTRLMHQGSAPSAPQSQAGNIYVKNSVLYYMSDNGIERTVDTT